MDRRLAATMWAAAALLASCGREARSRQETTSSSQPLAASERKLEVKLNGFVIDPRRGEPQVPAELDVPSAKVQVVERSAGEEDALAPPATVSPGRKSADAGKVEKWIVQLTGPIDPAEKQQLVDLGARIGDYLPDYAFVVAMDGHVRREVEGLPFVNGVVRYKPAFKVERRLKDEKGAVRVKDAKVATLQVRVDAPESLAALISEVHRQKGKVLRADGDVASVEVRPSAIARLAQLEEVVWLEEAAEVRLQNDTARWTIQTDVNGSARIWDHGLHGENQIVGVADTGLDHDMCFFRDPAGTPVGPAHRKVVGYVAYTDDHDGNAGHGTHVAGTLAGDRTPVTGASAGNGMAPKARLFITDLAPGEESIVHPPTDLGAVFQAAYDAGARLHSDVRLVGERVRRDVVERRSLHVGAQGLPRVLRQRRRRPGTGHRREPCRVEERPGGGASGFNVGIYLSADPVISTADLWVGYRHVSTLAPGASSAANTTLTLPTTLAGGTYYLGAIADDSNSARESDETNNSLAGGAITITGPDLVAVSASGPSSAAAGAVVTVHDTVLASVSGGATPGFYVGIFLSTDATITSSDLLLGSRYVGGLQPGGASAGSTSITIPGYVGTGTYYLGVIADNFPIWLEDEESSWVVENSAQESDGTNNALTAGAISIGTQVAGP